MLKNLRAWIAAAGWPWVVASLFVLALGTGLRLLGYFGDELQLWLDEAGWAQMLVEGTAAWIRPAGYMWLTGLLLSIVNNEQMLRSLSLVAGIAQLPLLLLSLLQALWWLSSTTPTTTPTTPTTTLTTTPTTMAGAAKWLALLGTFLLAINPVAVAMSKEFKPYALEATVHVLLAVWATAYCQSDRRRHLVGLVITAAVSPLLAWSVVFAYPGVFAVVGLRAWQARRRTDVVIGAVGGVATLLVLGVIWALRVSGNPERANFWGRKYDVFYVGRSGVDKLLWLLGKTADLLGFPARLEPGLPIPGLAGAPASGWLLVLHVVCVGLCLLGVATLIRKKHWQLMAIWLLPWIVALVFNLARKWPYGIFRTNAFFLFYALGFLGFGLAALGPLLKTPLARRIAIVVVVAVCVSVFPFDLGPFRVKNERALALSSSVRTALEKVYEEESKKPVDAPRSLVLLDGHACGIFEYYARSHVDTRVRFSAVFDQRLIVACTGNAAKKWSGVLRQEPRFVSKIKVVRGPTTTTRGPTAPPPEGDEDDDEAEPTTTTTKLTSFPYDWVISAKPGFMDLTLNEGRVGCASSTVDVLPASTVLLRCLRAPLAAVVPEAPNPVPAVPAVPGVAP